MQKKQQSFKIIGIVASVISVIVLSVITLVWVPPLLGIGTYRADGHLSPEIGKNSICYATYVLPESIEIGKIGRAHV